MEDDDGLYLVKTDHHEISILVNDKCIRLDGVVDLRDYMDQKEAMEYYEDLEEIVCDVSHYFPYLSYEVDDFFGMILARWDVVPKDTDELLLDVLKLQDALELGYYYVDAMLES